MNYSNAGRWQDFISNNLHGCIHPQLQDSFFRIRPLKSARSTRLSSFFLKRDVSLSRGFALSSTTALSQVGRVTSKARFALSFRYRVVM